MLEIEQVSKRYGRIQALSDVSIRVPEGAIVGLLGSNGAGKSTLLRIIAGYMPPSRGVVRLNGHTSLDDPIAMRRQIGYMPEDTPLYRDMRVKDFLWYRGRLKGLPPRRLRQRRRELLTVCGIESTANRVIGGLSRGYRQRLGLADALLHDPGVILLDEPLANLDPNQRRHMRDMIQGLTGRHTVLLSSHFLPDLDSICTHLIILHQGRLVSEGSPSELRAEVSERRTARMELWAPDGCEPDLSALAAHLNNGRPPPETVDVGGHPEVPAAASPKLPAPSSTALKLTHTRLEDGWFRLICDTTEKIGDLRPALFDWAVAAGWRVRELSAPDIRLEDVFASVTGAAPVPPEIPAENHEPPTHRPAAAHPFPTTEIPAQADL